MRLGLLVVLGLATVAASAAAKLLLASFGFAAFNSAFIVQLALYAAAVVIVHRGGRITRGRATIAVIVVAGLAFRLALVPGAPYLSDDVYRYVWDGRVQAAGVNPYRYVPGAPELAPLRDEAVFAHINRRSYAPTIYPPAAQVFFRVAHVVGGGVTGMKLIMVLVDLGTVVLLARLLASAGTDPARVIVYAWHPLACWEIGDSGHVDALALALLVAAIALIGARRRAFAAGLLLGLATLVKGYPALAVPALLRRGRAAFVLGFASAFVLYVPYVDVGGRVLGFLPSYVSEEGIASGERFPLLRALRIVVPGLPTSVYLALLAAALLAATWYVIRRPAPAATGFVAAAVARHVILLGGLAVVLGAPHYAWYYIWLVALATLAPSAESLWLGTSGALLYHTPKGATARLLFELVSPVPLLAMLTTRLPGAARLRARARAAILGRE